MSLELVKIRNSIYFFIFSAVKTEVERDGGDGSNETKRVYYLVQQPDDEENSSKTESAGQDTTNSALSLLTIFQLFIYGEKFAVCIR